MSPLGRKQHAQSPRPCLKAVLFFFFFFHNMANKNKHMPTKYVVRRTEEWADLVSS